MFEVRKAKQRGHVDLGWLQSSHTFSFGQYYDPSQIGFSTLRVINDDIVHPDTGFGMHSHQEMEIFTYILEGQLEHKDSMGNGSVIRPGDVQIMSAGTGVSHSEFNPSKEAPVHLLQIWVVPNKLRVAPRYDQKYFGEAEKRGKLKLIISPNKEEGSLFIYQDAKIYAGLLNGSESFDYQISTDRYCYLHICRGSLKVNNIPLEAGDGVKIRVSATLSFTEGNQAEVLVFDLKPQELPTMGD